MKKSRLLSAVCVFAVIVISPSAEADPVSGQGTWENTLKARDLDGDLNTIEAYYDTSLNVTWVDIVSPCSPIDYWNAKETSCRPVTFPPMNTVTDDPRGEWLLDYSEDGTTDLGTALPTTDGTDGGWRKIGEGYPVNYLGHLYYVVLGNSASNLTNTGPFTTLQPVTYWTGATPSPINSDFKATTFLFGSGLSSYAGFSDVHELITVYHGDVGTAIAPIPYLQISGAVQGGAIFLTVAGIELSILTTIGLTSEQVAQAIADAINNNPILTALGVNVSVYGNIIIIDAVLDGVTLTDPGLIVTNGFTNPGPVDGDINLDGEVNLADVLLGIQVLNRSAALIAEQYIHGDVAPLSYGMPDPDGLFTLGDLLVIERKALGLIDF